MATDDHLVVLSGGSRDGETTTVATDVRRLLAASDAPGMLEIYERTATSRRVRGNEDEAVVFDHVGQEPANDMSPELIHLSRS